MLQPIHDEKLLAIINSLQPISESEQLDELKKETLKKYISKANDDIYDMAHEKLPDIDRKGEYDFINKREKKAAQRSRGIGQAISKLKKGQYQESILDKLSVALEYLSEEQLDQVAEVIVNMLEETK